MPASAETTPGCAPVPVAAPAGAHLESVTAARQPGGTLDFPAQFGGPVTDVPAHCEVTVVLSHPGAGDRVTVRLALPETGWTGRFQALGGSAYLAGAFGPFGRPFAQAVKDGYAAGTTDAGVSPDPLDTSWGRKADGRLNTGLLTNFASRSAHELAVVGKAVTRAHYGRAADHSYWNGCSTGGRQGFAEAQRYPEDFDGILAAAPAVNWTEFGAGTWWPVVVMNQERTFPADCVFEEFRKAAVQACDGLDGLRDGIVNRPEHCGYDPRQLVGRTVDCGGKPVTVTAKDAEVVRKIWDGPRAEHGRALWAGLPKGADFSGLAHTEAGKAPGFAVAGGWLGTFVAPGTDLAKLTYREFAELFRQSERRFDQVIGTSEPDLSRFRAAGGKLLSWHGGYDQFVLHQGTSVAYREAVERRQPRVDEFYRLFLVPGAPHCAGGSAPAPVDPLGALVRWVEHGQAPDTLPAAAPDGSQRDLCRYPMVPRYTGHGDPKAAASFRCSYF
ncbi:tannase/feruloyl esterase family alpha/beta hydrolase [Crossiella equi]|uniref:tannase/feruloyl esterase family alpha/beta hydrolase n=1 Tax=Crossiella equi TaxID=130796 RepID=UPI000A3D517F|nr:tannase/feruloyl esterase family alpha/beta hydrolase [Crossiella equi]